MIIPTMIPTVVTFLFLVFFILGKSSVKAINISIPNVTAKSIPEIIGEISVNPKKNIINPPANVDNETSKILKIVLLIFSLLF